MVDTVYGIISDIHHQPEQLPYIIKQLKNAGAQKLIVNGDIGQTLSSEKASRQYLETVFSALAECGLETYIQPGSHERYDIYSCVADEYTAAYENIIDVVHNQKIKCSDHDIVFLPGSDRNAGGTYNLGHRDNKDTGPYVYTKKGFIPILEHEETPAGKQFYFQEIDDLYTLVTDPEKTIVVSHVPANFDGVDQGIDVAYFGLHSNGRIRPGIIIEKDIRETFGNVSADKIKNIASQWGFDLRRENVGLNYLREVFDDIGITKAINGHIHESCGNAHTKDGQPVLENTYVDELFWNASCIEQNTVGLLHVEDGKVSYENIVLDK